MRANENFQRNYYGRKERSERSKKEEKTFPIMSNELNS